MKTRVAIDALGGDHAPEEVVAGAAEAATDAIEPVLFGPADLDARGLELVPCTEEIAMDEKPAEAVRSKLDSSLVRAARAVGAGDASALVSAGNTGAALAASLLHVRRLPGVSRPGIAIVIPGRHGPTVLIDAGANADARPEHLVQFAHMGVVFAEEMLDVSNPSVRLLSIGEEPEKGNQLTLEAHALLEASDVRFDGNVEGRALLDGSADVVVCDGFTGNVALKTLEGTIRGVLEALRAEIRASARGAPRWPPHPTRRAEPPRPPRSRDVRRRVPPRAPGARGDLAWLELAGRDRERDPHGCARCGAPPRRPSRGGPADGDGPSARPSTLRDVIVVRSIRP